VNPISFFQSLSSIRKDWGKSPKLISNYTVITALPLAANFTNKKVHKVEITLTRIGTITIQVPDQNRALDFYTRKLGFNKRLGQPMGLN
jgi:catechol-2,3-dioxygenase